MFKPFIQVLNNQQKKKFYYLIILSLISGPLELLSVTLLLPLINILSNGNNLFGFEILNISKENILLLFIFFFILSIAFKLFTNYLIVKKTWLNMHLISKEILNLLLYDNFENFIKIKKSTHTKNLIQEVNNFANNVYSEICKLALNFSIVFFLLVGILYFSSYKIIILGVFVGFIFISFNFVIQNKLRHLGHLRSKDDSFRYNIISNAFENYELIKIHDYKEHIIKIFKKATLDFSKNMTKYQFYKMIFRPTIDMIIVFLMVLVIYKYFSIDENNRSIYLSEILLPIFALYRIISPLSQIYQSFTTLFYYKNSISIISNYLKRYEAQLLEQENKIDHDKKLGISIKIENISYNYFNNEKEIIHNLTFEFKHGNLYFINGDSGIGKSTLVNLIAGLLKPKKGRINYFHNGTNILPSNLNIGYAGQNTALFDGTLFENMIGFRDDGIKDYDKELKNLIDLFELRDWVNSLPNSLNTKISSSDILPSGGQGQRISIIRALIKKPQILILDESVSGIQKELCEKIILFIKEKYNNSIIILISHDKANLKYADLVLNL